MLLLLPLADARPALLPAARSSPLCSAPLKAGDRAPPRPAPLLRLPSTSSAPAAAAQLHAVRGRRLCATGHAPTLAPAPRQQWPRSALPRTAGRPPGARPPALVPAAGASSSPQAVRRAATQGPWRRYPSGLRQRETKG
ncbi:hypothetical protein SETIT_9G486600v2 [Setaria italica]|uniref:Uncharacterized protein n=2 Tax=Setaria TaxID=4554 RepID=A0A368SVV3_SETIT|nr:hypothetical protein SETIT_9G486600v2 [Setaria italica]TKV97386.1 hypothetical protein SEVIR_9G490800v2 [Setaria viridis]